MKFEGIIFDFGDTLATLIPTKEEIVSEFLDNQKYGLVHRHMRRFFLKLLSPLKYETAVDVGCGKGDNLLILSYLKNLKKLVGIDISDEAINDASKKVPVEYKVLDIQRESANEKFDMVFCSFFRTR